jgi:hypothetical protein
MVGGSLRVLRLLPPLKLVAMINRNIAEIGIKHNVSNQIKSNLVEKVILFLPLCHINKDHYSVSEGTHYLN